MQTKLPQAVASVSRVQSAEASPTRSIEQARIAFLSRRLRIEPPLAALVAGHVFGEARGQ